MNKEQIKDFLQVLAEEGHTFLFLSDVEESVGIAYNSNVYDMSGMIKLFLLDNPHMINATLSGVTNALAQMHSETYSDDGFADKIAEGFSKELNEVGIG